MSDWIVWVALGAYTGLATYSLVSSLRARRFQRIHMRKLFKAYDDMTVCPRCNLNVAELRRLVAADEERKEN